MLSIELIAKKNLNLIIIRQNLGKKSKIASSIFFRKSGLFAKNCQTNCPSIAMPIS